MMIRFSWSTLALVTAVAVLLLAPASADAQSSGAAKAIPRLADGKPDFNGIWDRPRVGDVSTNSNECGSGSPNSKGCTQKGAGPLPFTAWGAEQMKGERFDYAARCLPWGYTRAMQTAYPIELVQTPKRLAILFESNNVFHLVPTDGRPLPKDPEPSWLGYSSGRYEGDTLVIETTGFNGKTWIDTAEHPSSDQLKVTERLRHIDADRLEHEVTWEDPKTYSKPFKNVRVWVRMKPGEELMEWWCMENNKDLLGGHLTDTHLLERQ
jgi:hypothetical protein